LVLNPSFVLERQAGLMFRGVLTVFVGFYVALALGNEVSMEFKKDGNSLKKLSLSELQSKFKAQKVEAFDFEDQKKKTFLVVPFNDVADVVYGKDWKKMDDILFTCSDGYQPAVPMSEFTKHKAWLAFGIEGNPSFEVTSSIHQGKQVNYGPFILVWSNIGDQTLMAQGPDYWPYKLVAMEPISFAKKYPKLAPANNASAKVKEGFGHYRKNCMGCHTINGEGGKTSNMELNRPHNVTEYFKKEWLVKYIEHPQAVRESAVMPKFQKDGASALPAKVAKDQINSIVAYLEHMAKNKR